LNRRANFKTRR